MQVQKLPTGIEGFDDVCHGGLPTARSTLVSGTSGTGKTVLAEEVSNELQLLSSDIVNSAISDNQQQSYTDASKKLYLAYTIDKNAEDYLYYAASSSVNAGNWETALKFYLELKELNYQGIVTKYFVTKL